ncbi:MAG: SDR family oxidoreductase [Chloroflexota bacterium]
MKIIVFGANGGIGSKVVEQALEAGHQVTAVVRRPESITLQHPLLKVVQGNVLKYDTVQSAMVGQDVVISAIGVTVNEPTTVYSGGVANIIKAMQAHNVKRLMCISASGLDPGPLYQKVIAKLFLWRAFKHSYTDLVRMEAEVSANNSLNWTIVRPPRLTDKERTGHYKIAINKHLPNGLMLSRSDTADYMLTHLNDQQTYRGLVEIAY